MSNFAINEMREVITVALSASFGVVAGLLLKFGANFARELLKVMFEGKLKENEILRRRFVEGGIEIAIEWAESVRLISLSEGRGNPFKKYTAISPSTDTALHAIIRIDRRTDANFRRRFREIDRIMTGLAYSERPPALTDDQSEVLNHKLEGIIGELEFWLRHLTRNPTMSRIQISWHRALAKRRWI